MDRIAVWCTTLSQVSMCDNAYLGAIEMAVAEWNGDRLHVQFGMWGQIACLRKPFAVDASHIVEVVHDEGILKKLGWKLVGTGFPGLIAMGTYVWRGERQFVYWKRGQNPLVVQLRDHYWKRLIIGWDAHGAALSVRGTHAPK
jgi:hypothetical protein